MGVERSASRPGRALAPGKGPPVPNVLEAGWAPEPVWTERLQEKPFAPAGDRTSIVQSVARHYTDWATPASLQCHMTIKYLIFCVFVGLYVFLNNFSTTRFKCITALLNNVRKAGGLILCGSSCWQYAANFATITNFSITSAGSCSLRFMSIYSPFSCVVLFLHRIKRRVSIVVEMCCELDKVIHGRQVPTLGVECNWEG
jgi:hypothetical protein